MTNGKTLNKSQAHEMALAITPFISSYIEAHKSEYISWLVKSGLQDDTIKMSNSEADK